MLFSGCANTTAQEVRRQLVARKGPVFEMIALLSLHYSDPYPQYSETQMGTDEEGSIRISFSEFQLTFQFDGFYSTPFKLTKIESFHISDL